MRQSDPHGLRDEFNSLSKLLSVLFMFAALSLFADGLYLPLKGVVVGMFDRDPTAALAFQDVIVPLLPALLLLGALWQGRKLFQFLATGEILSADTASGVRCVGEWIVSAAIAGLIVGEVIPGARSGWALLAGVAAIGLALRSLAGVIDHAVAIKADHDQIV